jgi:hypothetical protein
MLGAKNAALSSFGEGERNAALMVSTVREHLSLYIMEEVEATHS